MSIPEAPYGRVNIMSSAYLDQHVLSNETSCLITTQLSTGLNVRKVQLKIQNLLKSFHLKGHLIQFVLLSVEQSNNTIVFYEDEETKIFLCCNAI